MGEPTELQRHILVALSRVRSYDAPPDSYELAESIAALRGIRSWERKRTSEAESVAACLKRMEPKDWAAARSSVTGPEAESEVWVYVVPPGHAETIRAAYPAPPGARVRVVTVPEGRSDGE